MVYQYRTKGTCARVIEFELENGIIGDVRFEGGCNGNHESAILEILRMR